MLRALASPQLPLCAIDPVLAKLWFINPLFINPPFINFPACASSEGSAHELPILQHMADVCLIRRAGWEYNPGSGGPSEARVRRHLNVQLTRCPSNRPLPACSQSQLGELLAHRQYMLLSFSDLR